MKKFLACCSLFGAVSLIATASISIVSLTQKTEIINYLIFNNFANYYYTILYDEKVELENLTEKFKITYNQFIDQLNDIDNGKINNVSIRKLQNNLNFIQLFMTKRISFETIMFMRDLKAIEHDHNAYIIYGFESKEEQIELMPYFHELENQYHFILNKVEWLQNKKQFNGLKINQEVNDAFLDTMTDWIFEIKKSSTFNINYFDYE